MSGMTIDEFFTQKNDFLINYALKKCQKYKRTYNAEEVVSEIYILSHKRQFENYSHLKGSVLRMIELEIRGENSKMNYTPLKERKKRVDYKDLIIEDDTTVVECNPVITYYENTTNIEHKILLEAYLDLGYNSQSKLAVYFGLSSTTINKLFAEIKKNILTLTKKRT